MTIKITVKSLLLTIGIVVVACTALFVYHKVTHFPVYVVDQTEITYKQVEKINPNILLSEQEFKLFEAINQLENPTEDAVQSLVTEMLPKQSLYVDIMDEESVYLDNLRKTDDNIRTIYSMKFGTTTVVSKTTCFELDDSGLSGNAPVYENTNNEFFQEYTSKLDLWKTLIGE